jgi:hypothetical protein
MMNVSKVIGRLLFLALIASSLLEAHADAPDVGKAIAVKNDVAIESGESKQALAKGASVHQDEVLVTGAAASAEIELLDKTKLAVGADARIVLDKFIYDANAAPGSIAINLSKGAFRFMTGSSPKAAYEIKTPTASLGVRGTIFDVYVAENGETAVLLHEGGVDVCNNSRSCQRIDKIGGILHVGVAGVFSSLLKWDGSIMKGIAVTKAFPFVGKRLAIDPIRRLTHNALLNGVPSIDRTITSPAGQLKRVLPVPGLPF